MRASVGGILFIFLWSGPASAQRIHYVDARAVGSGTGNNWTNAFPNLSQALEAAQPGERVWVAAGIYVPGLSRVDSFALREGVEVFGGFSGTEDPGTFDLRDRDFVTRETILSGEIGSSLSADNSYHVVTATAVSRSAILDGFTITGGKADGLTQLRQDMGAGMLIVSASPTIRWCLFRGNHAGSRGGAVHIASGSPRFSHCRFVQNQTTVTQGSANLGGAAYLMGTVGQTTSAEFINCLFTGNRAGVGNGGTGGGIYVADYALAKVVNCTIFHNVADTLTGGVIGPAQLVNSIVWGNGDRNGTTPTAQLRGAVVASHCLVEGGWPGTGNINENPAFVSILGVDAIAGTLDDNARLTSESPGIDAGDDLGWPPGVEPADLDGAARFFGGAGSPSARIDIGAYERQQPCLLSSDCDDGRWCNGSETCVDAVCRNGVAPDCDDGVDCTLDSCDSASDSCIHQPASAMCNNQIHCDGSEVCDPVAGCLPGAAPDCDDEVDCTIDTCDEANDACRHEVDDSFCDDGVFCNGVERCGPVGCAGGTPPCTASQVCDEAASSCITQSEGCHDHADCEDGNDCTDHRCEDGQCSVIYNTNACDDQNACTFADTCVSGFCVGTNNPNCNVPPQPGPDDDPTQPPMPSPDDNPGEPPGNGDEPPGEEEDKDDPDEDSIEEPPADSPLPCAESTDCPPGPADGPEDGDQDGVPDGVDICPDSPPAATVDIFGCGESEGASGHGIWGTPVQRRCGACGALGSVGGILMLGVPGTALLIGRSRGRNHQTPARQPIRTPAA